MIKKLTTITAITLVSFCLFACSGGGDDSVQPLTGNEPGTPVVEQPTNKVWTVNEILQEPTAGGGTSVTRCGGEGGFRRCVCASEVPGFVRYRPAVVECNGNAAAILSGRLSDVFSIVVRDTQNRDRWPAAGSGFGGCSFQTADSKDPPKACSAFKAQNRFKVADGSIEVHCFGASGYSDIFKDAARVTVKLSDDPFSNDDDIERYCLRGGSLPLN